MKINILPKNKKLMMRRMLSSFGMITIIAGFIFSAPSPVVKNVMVRDMISDMQKQNEKAFARLDARLGLPGQTIAYAQDDTGYVDDFNNYPPPSENPETIYGCTTYGAPGYNPLANTDDGSCGMYGCMDGNALNYNGQATVDDASCQYSRCSDSSALNNGEAGSCKYKEEKYGCTSLTAENYDPQATIDDGSCSNPVYGCMEVGNPKYDFLATVDDGSCAPTNTYCCDGNFDNNTEWADRHVPYECNYTEPTCGCNAYPPHTGSQCGDGDTTATCAVHVTFSAVKEGVQINGNADTTKAFPCTIEDDNYLRGLAATAASPITPLNTTMSIDSLTTYVVTSKDYCLNIAGGQSYPTAYNRTLAGFCCDVPSLPNNTGDGCVDGSSIPQCGSASLTPTDAAPTSGLCSNGTPSNVSEQGGSFVWSCGLTGGSSSQCSVAKTCNGGSCTTCTDLDCGPDDQCLNKPGINDSAYISSNNLFQDTARYCWNNVTGACGTSDPGPVPKDGPTSNLCASPATLMSAPAFNGSKWQWTCQDTNGSQITPPSVCEARPCSGSECTTASSILIQKFVAQPAIVSASDKFCQLSWNTTVDNNQFADQAGVCTINNSSTYNGHVIYDDNPADLGLIVPPGSYDLACTDSQSNSQTKTVKCIVKPGFKEI